MRRQSLGHTKRRLAHNLRRLRYEKTWSQHDLAHEVSVRQGLVIALEIAKANLTLESLDKIAAARRC
jgi:transcriptional regulator with XRE-family HTH domain